MQAMQEDDEYTKDGTTDFRNNPALRKHSGTWKACPYILGNECCERLAYYGINTNLVNYLKFQLNQRNVEAVNNVTNWSGTCYVTPLLGAFLADAYLGRYWTIACFSIIYVFGMTLLTLSTSLNFLKPHCDIIIDDRKTNHTSTTTTCHPTRLQTTVFFIGLYMIALGTGGIKPCVSSFGADQFDDSNKTEKKNKTSFFNWFYFSINIGALVAASVLVWVQTNVGWAWGFGIPAAAMAVAVVSFFAGTRLYRMQRPRGSPITRVSRVIVATIRKFKVIVPKDKSLLYETTSDEECGGSYKGCRKLQHTEQLSLFDKAAVVTSPDQVKLGTKINNNWTLCTVSEVEEVKSIVRLLPIWACGIIFSAAYSQMGTLFVLQANTMDLHMGPTFQIPAASLSLFDTLSVILWVPLYDRFLVPLSSRLTRHPHGLTRPTRIAIGLGVSALAMVLAGVLERVRLERVEMHASRMSVFWQVPQYVVVGCAEVFAVVGQLEMFYEEAPEGMRSLCSALSLTTSALGNYLSSLLVSVVTRVTTAHGGYGWIPDNLNYGKLHYFFWLLALLSLINLGVFVLVAKWYTCKNKIVLPNQ